MKLFPSLFLALLSCTLLRAESDEPEHKRLVLTDSVKTNMPTSSSVANFSPSAHHLFVAYWGGAQEPIPANFIPQPPYIQAEIFKKNDDGKLHLEATLDLDLDTFSNAMGGIANPDFSRFVIFDGNQGTTPDLRIRVFDSSLTTPLATTIVTNSFLQGGAGQQYIFTDDGKYFAVNIVIDNEIFLRIYKTENLEPLFDYDIGSFDDTDSETPVYFRICKDGKIDEFFAIGIARFDNAGSLLTANLDILKFDREHHHSLKLYSETSQPQRVRCVSTFRVPTKELRDHVLIGVTTQRADLEDEVITFQVPSPSLLRHDGDEVRLLRYDGKRGKKAKLVASQNAKLEVEGISLDPTDHGKTIATSLFLSTTISNPSNPHNLGFFPDAASFGFLLQQLSKHAHAVAPKAYEEVGKIYSVGTEPHHSEFSLDGKWLVASGCKGPQTVPAPPDQAFLGTNNNVQLFKVVKR